MKNIEASSVKETSLFRSCVRQTVRSRLTTSQEHRCVALCSRFHSIEKYHRLSSRRSERSASDPSNTNQVRTRNRDDAEQRCSLTCDDSENIRCAFSPRSARFTRSSTRLQLDLHQSLSLRRETMSHSIPSQIHKNFFESLLSQALHDPTGFIRSSIAKMIDGPSTSSDRTDLVDYLNRRYPRLKTARTWNEPVRENSFSHQLGIERENSQMNVHHILNLFDPDLRPKVAPPKPPAPKVVPSLATRQPMTFKRLGTKLTTIALFSRGHAEKKR